MKLEYCLFKNNHDALFNKLKQLEPTRRWKITVIEWKSKRNYEQNRLMWQFFTDFAQHVGYEGKDEIEDLKLMVTMKVHAKIVTDKSTGEVIKLPPETSKMNTKEFSEMMDKVMRYAHQLGFYWEE